MKSFERTPRRHWRTIVSIAIVGLSLAVLAVGCGQGNDAGDHAEGQNESAPGQGSGAGGEGPGTGDERVDPYLAFAQDFAQRLDEHFASQAEPPDLVSRLEARLEAALAVAEKRRTIEGKGRPERDLYYEGQLDDFYMQRAYKPAFTRSGHVTDASRELFAVLGEADQHALDPADYHVDELQPMLDRSVELSQAMKEHVIELTDAELAAIAAWLEKMAVDVESEQGQARAVELLIRGGGEDGEHPASRLLEAFSAYTGGEDELAELSVELEVKLADGYLRYARDMRHANINQLAPNEIEAFERPLPIEHHTTVILARLRKQLDAWTSVEKAEPAEVRAHLEALWPPSEQYPKLVAAYAHYRKIVDEGGWGEVAPKALRKGQDSSTVAAVKKRLTAEGYYDGPIDNAYDEGFIEAMDLYQETHQLEVTGESSKVFWRSLNKSAEDRLQEIEINLRRWRRDTHIRDSDYYVYINVPDFHAEVWRDGVRQMRFRIVTGNTERVCDPKTEQWTYANATPLQAARMDYLVLNPYWHVPPRIEREEYVEKMLENPNWLEENNFEYYTDPGGYKVLRQLPGDSNALGRVKFIFPNMHSTFMHDTPKKQFFRYPVRAFSHGCMRVQDPMDLAEFILSNDGKWDAAQPYINSLNNKQINLDKPIDVFIDYTTVRVDDQDRVHFLADIYKYVQDEISPPTARALKCDPEPVETLSQARARLEAPADDGVEMIALPPALQDPDPGLGNGDAGTTTPTPRPNVVPPPSIPAVEEPPPLTVD